MKEIRVLFKVVPCLFLHHQIQSQIMVSQGKKTVNPKLNLKPFFTSLVGGQYSEIHDNASVLPEWNKLVIYICIYSFTDAAKAAGGIPEVRRPWKCCREEAAFAGYGSAVCARPTTKGKDKVAKCIEKL